MQNSGYTLILVQDQNWVLYYSLITQHLKELVPIIYTPTQVRYKQPDTHLTGIDTYIRPKLSQTIRIYFAAAKACILRSMSKIQWRGTISNKHAVEMLISLYAQTPKLFLVSAIKVSV